MATAKRTTKPRGWIAVTNVEDGIFDADAKLFEERSDAIDYIMNWLEDEEGMGGGLSEYEAENQVALFKVAQDGNIQCDRLNIEKRGWAVS